MRIRVVAPKDAEAIAAIYAPHVAAGYASFEAAAPTAADMAQRIDQTLATHPWLVAEREDVICGYAYAGPHRTRSAYQWSCDVSVYVDPDAQRNGVGRRLYTALFEILAEQGFCQAYAGIALPNPASVSLHEKVGFEPVGVYRNVGFKDDAWRDVGWWARALRAPPASPTPPTPFAALHRRM